MTNAILDMIYSLICVVSFSAEAFKYRSNSISYLCVPTLVGWSTLRMPAAFLSQSVKHSETYMMVVWSYMVMSCHVMSTTEIKKSQAQAFG